MAKIKVGIYCGHGRQTNGVWDPGATYGSEKEAARMLPITEAFVKYAKLNGFEVITDVPKNNINMVKQVEKSEANDVDVHISIHCDWYKSSSGSFGLYCKGSKKGKKLATCLNTYVKAMTGIRSKGITARTDLYELNKTSMPACVFECGSIKADRYEWDTAAEADEYGRALCKGLCKYYGKTFIEEKSTVKTPFKVKVTADALNIRKGSGTEYKKVGTIKDKGVYTIMEVSGNWGKLKSSTVKSPRWIHLGYTKEL